MNTKRLSGQQKASEFAAQLAALPQVVAVALGGSQASGAADTGSDIDLYAYTQGEISPAEQAELIERCGGATRTDLGLPYWGGINMWTDATTGIIVDCVYFDAVWMEQQVVRVMEEHQPSMGYSTSFCRTVQQSEVLYDPRGWFQNLQARCNQAYPEALQHNIISYNHPLLRTIMSSYLYQIERAVGRGDTVSLNHRVAALLASYFDIVFALNRVLHPGEKRLLAFACNECKLLPTAFESDIPAVLAAAGTATGDILLRLNKLLDRLDELLETAGFKPAQLKPPQ